MTVTNTVNPYAFQWQERYRFCYRKSIIPHTEGRSKVARSCETTVTAKSKPILENFFFYRKLMRIKTTMRLSPCSHKDTKIPFTNLTHTQKKTNKQTKNISDYSGIKREHRKCCRVSFGPRKRVLGEALLTASKTLAQHSIIILSIRKKENKRVLMRTSKSKSLSLNLFIKER